MNWKPTEGMRRAQQIVEQIEQASDALGITHPSFPMHSLLKHRVFELVSESIDEAIDMARDPELRDDASTPPSLSIPRMGIVPAEPPDEDAGYVDSLVAAAPPPSDPVTVGVPETGAPKRGRGRPRKKK